MSRYSMILVTLLTLPACVESVGGDDITPDPGPAADTVEVHGLDLDVLGVWVHPRPEAPGLIRVVGDVTFACPSGPPLKAAMVLSVDSEAGRHAASWDSVADCAAGLEEHLATLPCYKVTVASVLWHVTDGLRSVDVGASVVLDCPGV